MFNAKLLIQDCYLSVVQTFGSPTRVTKLQVATNMADPISWKHLGNSLEVTIATMRIQLQAFALLPGPNYDAA